MAVTTEIASRLMRLANKYGDFKVARGYARGEEKKFSKMPECTVMAVILRDKHNVFKSVGESIFGLSSFKEGTK